MSEKTPNTKPATIPVQTNKGEGLITGLDSHKILFQGF
jgi:hypothetical protein